MRLFPSPFTNLPRADTHSLNLALPFASRPKFLSAALGPPKSSTFKRYRSGFSVPAAALAEFLFRRQVHPPFTQVLAEKVLFLLDP